MSNNSNFVTVKLTRAERNILNLAQIRADHGLTTADMIDAAEFAAVESLHDRGYLQDPGSTGVWKITCLGLHVAG